MGHTILFTHLKIILLQYFQFSVSAKISCIQTDPKKKYDWVGKINYIEENNNILKH